MPGEEASRARLPLLVAVVLIVGVHFAGRVGAFCSPIHADSYAYGTVGYRLAQGEVFYRDVSDVKPPGLYFLYALFYAFLPAGRVTMIPADTLFGLLGYWAVFLLGRDLYGRSVGVVVAVMAALIVNFFIVMDFITDAFGLAEAFMIFPLAMAARSYLRGTTGTRGAPFLWCGLWLGMAFAIKQTALPLAGAIALHWTARWVARQSSFGCWLRGARSMLVGMVIAVMPMVIMVVAQGTWRRALELLGPAAAGMLARESAWPTQWSYVLPLWVPLVWCVLAIIWWAERGVRSRRVASVAPGDLTFLLVWCAAECVMLVYLPLRAFHYYVLSSLPVVILSGAFWKLLMETLRNHARRVMVCGVAAAAVFSMAFVRLIPDMIVPAAIARYRLYDATADRAHFEKVLSLKINTFGAPPPPPKAD